MTLDSLQDAVTNHINAIRAVIPAEQRNDFHELARLAMIGAAHSQVQIEKAKTSAKNRQAANELRNLNMAKEFQRLKRNPWEDLKDTKLMEHVGKLPRFRLKRSAAINAIQDGLKHHSLQRKS